jgi:hypothetical protein
MSRIRRILRAASAAALLVAATAAQSSGPAVCFGFNEDTTSGISSLPLVAGGEVYVGFVAPATITIERIDFYSAALPAGAGLTIDVYHDNGGTLGPLLGSGAGIPPYGGWIATPLTAPVLLFDGIAYALRFTIASGSVAINGDIGLPTALPYVLNCGANPPFQIPPCTSFPITGTHGTRLRFRANGCGPTPYAVATQVGTSCGGAPANLFSSGPPVLGTVFTFFVNSFLGGGPIHIYWAAGAATAGTNLGIGGGCTAWLDLVSLQALANQGFEPLLNFPVTGITNSATTFIPFDPALAGIQVTTQAVQFTPAGFPTSVGPLVVTNALELTLGY